MCILFIARQQHPRYPLIIAANRDEFYARPTAPAAFWDDAPSILAGRDFEANGTWMGVTQSGKIAAITNVRAPSEVRTDAISRGELVTNWLKDDKAQFTGQVTEQLTEQYLQTLSDTRHRYNGYNLVFGNASALHVYNNVNNSVHPIQQGVFGLSNADIITPWPKVTQGVTSLNKYVSQHDTINTEDLFALLRNEDKADDQHLPSTGIGYEWEKALSSIFINIPSYGTRTSTILLVDSSGELSFKERTFTEKGETTQTREFSFKI
ncbi:NRDE family protein [Alteromonas sp. BMJM2]|uniref:NRDE family protein n=1 Tax=Alteromonas sp. BMJM2 TaxID=2954241 RepID=UPI0022B2B3B0|nr:NRDE family protein [Alteromonas sp. BMJM2]